MKERGYGLREALGADLAWITAHAEAVVVLKGWRASKGAVAEVATAQAIGVPVWIYGHFLTFGRAAPQVKRMVAAA